MFVIKKILEFILFLLMEDFLMVLENEDIW